MIEDLSIVHLRKVLNSQIEIWGMDLPNLYQITQQDEIW